MATERRIPSVGGALALPVVAYIVVLSAVIAFSVTSESGNWLPTFGSVLLFTTWVVILALAVLFLLVRLVRVQSDFIFGMLTFVSVMLASAGLSMALLNLPFAPVEAIVVSLGDPMWFVLRTLAIAACAAAVALVYWALLIQSRKQLAAETGVRMNALQSRIRPHFLFNTLNTISSLIHDRPEQAEQATMDLADLLRTGLKDEPTHALSDELDLIRGYLRIEQLRLGDRLNIEWDISEEVPLGQQLPPLLLQPLVENAVIHGISRRAEGGALRIEGRCIRFARIRFTVTNPLADPDSRPAEGNQSALENIRQRLALAFEERHGLKTWVEDGHFMAELTIPVT